jgi:beta-glucosidase-like glycosyl hydrolase
LLAQLTKSPLVPYPFKLFKNLKGCDINSGSQYSHYVEAAVKAGLVNESVVDAALINAFRVRIRLGLFDPLGGQPDYSDPRIAATKTLMAGECHSLN